jgi:hypothetical protein
MSLPPSVPRPAASADDERASDRRLHERLPINCQVYLCWKDALGNQMLRAQAVEISKFGMLVETEKSIAPGTLVSVQTNSTNLGTACVRHCTPQGLKYKIGLHMPDRMSGHFHARRAAASAGRRS